MRREDTNRRVRWGLIIASGLVGGVFTGAMSYIATLDDVAWVGIFPLVPSMMMWTIYSAAHDPRFLKRSCAEAVAALPAYALTAVFLVVGGPILAEQLDATWLPPPVRSDRRGQALALAVTALVFWAVVFVLSRHRLTSLILTPTPPPSYPEYKAWSIKPDVHRGEGLATSSGGLPRDLVKRIPDAMRKEMAVVAAVFPFRINAFVARLIDWNNLDGDHIARLVLPNRRMLSTDDFRSVQQAIKDRDRAKVQLLASQIQGKSNPHPDKQVQLNIPRDGQNDFLDDGIQHKYRHTVLYFPAAGQTCHAYCGFCFRWGQFVPKTTAIHQFKSTSTNTLVQYVLANPEIKEVIITGGDPMIMSPRHVGELLNTIIDQCNGQLKAIRIATKSLTYWPYVFIKGTRSGELLDAFRRVVDARCHISIQSHITHPRELTPLEVTEAVDAVRSTGAVIRSQAPVIRGVNDDGVIWADMWAAQLTMGIVPYYMFVARETGPRHYFRVPLHQVYKIYRQAIDGAPSLASTARGPVMSTHAGKVVITECIKKTGRWIYDLAWLSVARTIEDERIRSGKPLHHRFKATSADEAYWLTDLRQVSRSN